MNRLLFLFLILLLAGCDWLAHTAVDTPPAPPPIQLPVETTAVHDLDRLLAAEILPRDLPDLTRRYKQVDVPTQLPQTSYQTREVHTFWYKEGVNDTPQQVEARLVYQDEQLQLWVDQSERIDVETLAEVVRVLNDQILPTNRHYFGEDDLSLPLNILHISDIGGGTIGYFSAADGFSTAVNPYSNERKMVYISLRQAPLGSRAYYDVLAHELQHMIQWHVDGNETTWLNEGLSELAVTLNEYGMSQHTSSFLTLPDTPLTNFQYNSADYGAAYLFATYFHDRMGGEAVRQLARDGANGLRSVQNALDVWGDGLTAEALFGEWVVANYVASHGRGQGIYQYESITLPTKITPSAWPREAVTSTVNQFGTDYYRLTGDAPVTLAFTGTTQTRLLETEPYSGAYFWSTVPSDSSNMHLTRAFDLTAVSAPTATLSFWTWYDIELGWDYAYLAVSDDDGATWTTLETIATSRANPHGNNLGAGFTGTSGSHSQPEWREQIADISDYIGTENLLVRFKYVTDDAVQNPGFAVDDVRLDVLNFVDDVESDIDAANWTAVGFVRHGNILPQTWLVQQILLPSNPRDGIQVSQIDLNDLAQGRWTVPLGNGFEEAIITISATNPVTMSPASYQISNER